MPAGNRRCIKAGEQDIMNQQINLYQPVFRKQKKVFSALAMLQVGFFSVLLFSLSGAYSYFQLRELQEQEQASASRLENMQRQIAALQSTNSDQSAIRLLDAEINRLTREIENKKQLADALSRGAYANTEGFSKHLEAIARQHVEGSWLTSIDLHEGGTILYMNGVTYSAELLPVYLQRLLQEDIFSGTSFNVLGMERSDENDAEITFQVGTKIDGEPGGSS